MENYKILINEYLNNHEVDYFNSLDFFKYHSKSDEDIYFQLIKINTNQILGEAIFYKCNGAYSSPIKGSYGGFDYNSNISYETINFFISYVLKYLLSKNPKEIIVKLKPSCYSEKIFSVSTNILLNNGFRILKNDLNYSCLVTKMEYVNKIKYGAKKRIKKCKKHGYDFKFLSNSKWNDVYTLIKNNRESKGIKISMDINEFESHINSFSDKIILFGVTDNKDTLIASSVCIKNNKDSLYVFYWGEIEEKKDYSPVIILSEGIYNYCKLNSIRLLDIGTSTINGKPLSSLIKFKESLGFEASSKMTLSLKRNQ